ncbi:hypothetical protein BUALT_Bualt15G0117800 [Buddleja alternifolia]|uniref:GATA-type domain-containing protein n=1 Tax=Buddleja alternifolia TaxID=168488 RepID=A0AAV6WCX1_9LAMI|nr:hypothetical protein BUALT_Bualt15G0117800 [Buddleja alternifolia]
MECSQKSLCNACGIRYRKKRPIATAATPKNDLKKGKIRGKRRNHHHRHQRDRRMRVKLMTGVGNNYIGQKKRSGGRQWGEVERAALLLMALSCGAVFA